MSPVRLLKAFISSVQPIALIGCLVIDEFKFLQLTFDLTVEGLQNGVCPEQVRKQRNSVFLQVQAAQRRIVAGKLSQNAGSISELLPSSGRLPAAIYGQMRCPDTMGTHSQRWSGITERTRLTCDRSSSYSYAETSQFHKERLSVCR